jgi:hypothetical protein
MKLPPDPPSHLILEQPLPNLLSYLQSHRWAHNIFCWNFFPKISNKTVLSIINQPNHQNQCYCNAYFILMKKVQNDKIVIFN